MNSNWNWPLFATSIIFNSVIIIVFITLFFFTYISKIERNVVNNQVTSLIEDLNRELSIIIDDKEKATLREFIQNSPIDYSSDAKVADDNKKIRNKAYKTLGIIVGVGVALIIGLTLIFKLDLSKLLVSGVVSLAAVAITEFIFATFFAQNFKTLDENKVKLELVRTLREYVSQNE